MLPSRLPHTAINCINRIGGLLIDVGHSYRESSYLTDEQGQLRLTQKPKTYEDYLYQSFYQIRHYGQDDVSVIYGMLEVLYKVAVVSKLEIRRKIWTFHYYILDIVKWDDLSSLDQNHLHEMYVKLEDCCQEKSS